MQQADINFVSEWNSKFREAKQAVCEFHYSTDCHYEQIANVHIIGKSRKMFVIVRVCYCGEKRNKENILKKILINIEDFYDGVEIHLDSRCDYKKKRLPDGRRKLEKICYCPKHIGY